MNSKKDVEQYTFHLKMMYLVQEELECRLKDENTSKEDRNFAIKHLHDCDQLICEIIDLLKSH